VTALPVRAPNAHWVRTGLLLALVAGVIYFVVNPNRPTIYNHFVWQADAFLNGRFAIRFPVLDDFSNWYLQDVMPLPGRPGFGLIPFPPLPAILLMPVVAVFGLATDQSLLAVAFGALNVALAWRMVGRLTTDRRAALVATLFFAFGTVHFYAAMLGSTWFYAHVVAVTFTLLAVTAALDAQRNEQARSVVRPALLTLRGARLDGLSLLAGLALGLAALARLPVAFGLPFLLLVGGGPWPKRIVSAGIGIAIPLLVLLVYNLVSSGAPFSPAYDWLYHTEYLGYLPPQPCPFPNPDFCSHLVIDRTLGAEDPRHVPLNALIMFAWPPTIQSDCGLSMLDPDCPLISPSPIGLSILLTSPGYLLAVPALRRLRRDRVVLGAALAVVAIALVNLMHFSQGWVQFGYRFSNDFAPFATVLVAAALARLGARWWTVALVVTSIAINAWGVYWGIARGW
jgi:4-amino-4-deoxy-L-arabinose transferase-like glycosyltransferase